MPSGGEKFSFELSFCTWFDWSWDGELGLGDIFEGETGDDNIELVKEMLFTENLCLLFLFLVFGESLRS